MLAIARNILILFSAGLMLLVVGCGGPITGGTLFDDIWLLGVITVVLLIIVIVLLIMVAARLSKTYNPELYNPTRRSKDFDLNIRCPYCNSMTRVEETFLEGATFRCRECKKIL